MDRELLENILRMERELKKVRERLPAKIDKTIKIFKEQDDVLQAVEIHDMSVALCKARDGILSGKEVFDDMTTNQWLNLCLLALAGSDLLSEMIQHVIEKKSGDN